MPASAQSHQLKHGQGTSKWRLLVATEKMGAALHLVCVGMLYTFSNQSWFLIPFYQFVVTLKYKQLPLKIS